MQKQNEKAPKQAKAKRRRGILAQSNRFVRLTVTAVLAVVSASLTFLQLGFAGLGSQGEYFAYAILLLLPVALAALLLGVLAGMLMGLFAGTVLYIHASLMPLNFYELTFVTPLTSIVMLAVVGLMLGFLFSFALRNNPSMLRASIYIAIVCTVVSVLYSIGFLTNVIIQMIANLTTSDFAGMGYEEINGIVQTRVTTIAWRMGSLSTQATVDAIGMSLLCIISYIVVVKNKGRVHDIGLRELFAIRLMIVVFFSFMTASSVAFAFLTQSEYSRAEDDMHQELEYLWRQSDNVDNRIYALADNLFDEEDNPMVSDEQLEEILKGNSISTVLDGYRSSDDGIVLFLVPPIDNETQESVAKVEDYQIVASDDDRFKEGSILKNVASPEVIEAIEDGVKSGRIERAIYDENFSASLEELSSGDRHAVNSDIIYTCSSEKEDEIFVVVYPAEKVFAARGDVMTWTALLALLLFTAVLIVVFILLDRVIVRRIDDTNKVLGKITDGKLDEEVTVRDPREFAALSDGINETVGALRGWIAEAESRMDTELATAKAIQESALPRVFPPFPDIPKFDLFASMQAAKEVGGDFYDFFLIGDDSGAEGGKLGFVMADVSGKGIPAALFMMKAKTQLRDYLEGGVEIGEAVENANRRLCDGNDEGMFVTLWAGVLDYGTGHVDYVNAGHNPPLFFQKDKGWTWLKQRSGLPLGLYDGLPYEAHTLDCNVGDCILLYTDGVTEAMNTDEELYGEERLEELAKENGSLPSRLLAETVRNDVALWASGAEQSDDITIMALEVGRPPEKTASLEVNADTAELPRVNELIHDELDKRLCPKRVQSQLDIAVEELFVNVARYAYPDATPESPGKVTIQRTYSANPTSVVVRIIDAGVPYNPLAKPDATTVDEYADIDEIPIGGLGIFMAKRNVDEMHYERSGGKNIMTIVKKW